MWKVSHRAYLPVLGFVAAALLAGCQLLAPNTPRTGPGNVTPVPAATRRPAAAAPSLSATAAPATPAPAVSPAPSESAPQGEAMVPASEGDLAKTANLNHYTIDLDLDVRALTYTGHQTLDYTNVTTATLDALVFRVYPNAPVIYGGGALTVTRALVDGQAGSLQPDAANPTVLRLGLPRPVEPGGRRKVDLTFEGRVPTEFGTDRKGYGIFNFGEDILTLADFYPLLAAYQDGRWHADRVYAEGDAVFAQAALYSVTLKAPADWLVAATGVEVDRSGSGADLLRSYASGPVREFMLALSPDFRAASAKVGDTAVNSYFLADHQDRGQAALEFATAALEDYNKRFGLYPYRELDVVEAPLNLAAGVEYPGLVLIGSDFYTGEQNAFFEVATVHEVAHQWWYNVVGNDVINNPWEDEALAQYSSAIYDQDVRGERTFERQLAAWRQAVDRAEQGGKDIAVGAPLSFFAGTNLYGPIVYEKGPLFFQAVRDRIGDDAFFSSLQQYYTTYKYGVAPPRGFVDIAEKVSGKNLDDVYQEWIVKGEGG